MKENIRMAHELKRMAPKAIYYTLEEAIELVENGAPWNLWWYTEGYPEWEHNAAGGNIRWKLPSHSYLKGEAWTTQS